MWMHKNRLKVHPNWEMESKSEAGNSDKLDRPSDHLVNVLMVYIGSSTTKASNRNGPVQHGKQLVIVTRTYLITDVNSSWHHNIT